MIWSWAILEGLILFALSGHCPSALTSTPLLLRPQDHRTHRHFPHRPPPLRTLFPHPRPALHIWTEHPTRLSWRACTASYGPRVIRRV